MKKWDYIRSKSPEHYNQREITLDSEEFKAFISEYPNCVAAGLAEYYRYKQRTEYQNLREEQKLWVVS